MLYKNIVYQWRGLRVTTVVFMAEKIQFAGILSPKKGTDYEPTYFFVNSR
jgi:hypothetical protein